MTEVKEGAKYLSLFEDLVQALKTGQHDAIDTASKAMNANPKIREKPNYYQFVIIVLRQPMVFIEILCALVYMELYGTKITQKIKSLFTDLTYQDTINLCESENPIFYRDLSIQANPETDKKIKISAKSFYVFIIETMKGEPTENVTKLIKQIVKIADILLGNSAGSKALQACQIAVYTSGAATLLVSYGCENNISGLTPEQCAEARLAKSNLINASE